MRAKAVVSYDGTAYSGFQRQADVPTVQQTLEEALAEITQEAITVLAAGRTDAGVHAVGQVIAFDTAWEHTIDDLQRAMNAVLPADVAVRALEEVASGFHPRYDARSRRYRYLLYNAPMRCPLARRYSLHVAASLDVEAMQEAACLLVGEHDFATFGQPPQGEITVRRILEAEWRRLKWALAPFGGSGREIEGGWLAFDIEGNAFLYRMVRSIVGTLLDVGRGRMSVGEFGEALASCDRGRAGKTASAHGLFLMEVAY